MDIRFIAISAPLQRVGAILLSRSRRELARGRELLDLVPIVPTDRERQLGRLELQLRSAQQRGRAFMILGWLGMAAYARLPR